MDVVYPCCGGLDAHQRTVVACVFTQAGPRVTKVVQTFGAMTADLEALRAWLVAAGCTHVAMESTGGYWKPVWNVLEGAVQILLVNAQHIKAVPGRKTDVKDCEWLASLLRHGLLRGSDIPEAAIRELRDLTRHRTTLVKTQQAVGNRIQKVLEDANIKLAAVASKTLGKSGLAMVEALIAGVTDAEALAELACGRLKAKHAALREAMNGRVTARHRFLLRGLLGEFRYLEQAIARVSTQIAEHRRPYEAAVQRVDEIPGVDERTAEHLLAERGVDLQAFPSDRHLASWAGMCPGHNESAGKRKSGKTRKGSPWLRRTLTQAAWVASPTEHTYLKAQYHCLAARRGKKRAIVAVGHSILVMAYHILKDGRAYHELGEGFLDRQHATRLTTSLVRKLESLGHKVTLEPCPTAA